MSEGMRSIDSRRRGHIQPSIRTPTSCLLRKQTAEDGSPLPAAETGCQGLHDGLPLPSDLLPPRGIARLMQQHVISAPLVEGQKLAKVWSAQLMLGPPSV
jgi:hypothetical protein